jgi:hypothetical protein
VASAPGVLDVRHRVVGAEASRPSALECGARAGNPSSRLDRSDRDPRCSACDFVSNAARRTAAVLLTTQHRDDV